MEEEWDHSLSVPRLHSWWDIIAYIKEYGDLTPRQLKFVIEVARQLTYINYESLLDEGLNKYPELVNIGGRLILKMSLSNPWDFVNNIDRYLVLERARALDPHILQDYQRLLLQYIMNGLKRWKEEPDSDKWFFLFRDSMRTLYLRSQKFPRSLLDGLMKRFGIDEYPKVVEHEHQGRNWKNVLEQPTLTQWDVGVVFHRGGPFSKDIMEKIAQKVDAEGYEYIKGFIYHDDEKNENAPNTYFILDEERNPMDMFMKKREWPAQTTVMEFSWMPEEVQKIWGPIVADFGLVMR